MAQYNGCVRKRLRNWTDVASAAFWLLRLNSSLRQGPDLVGVVRSTRPSLHDLTVAFIVIGQVEAQACMSRELGE